MTRMNWDKENLRGRCRRQGTEAAKRGPDGSLRLFPMGHRLPVERFAVEPSSVAIAREDEMATIVEGLVKRVDALEARVLADMIREMKAEIAALKQARGL